MSKLHLVEFPFNGVIVSALSSSLQHLLCLLVRLYWLVCQYSKVNVMLVGLLTVKMVSL